jgi:hypothetical protein
MRLTLISAGEICSWPGNILLACDQESIAAYNFELTWGKHFDNDKKSKGKI